MEAAVCLVPESYASLIPIGLPRTSSAQILLDARPRKAGPLPTGGAAHEQTVRVTGQSVTMMGNVQILWEPEKGLINQIGGFSVSP